MTGPGDDRFRDQNQSSIIPADKMRKIIPANDLWFGFAVAALLVMVSAGHGEFIENQPAAGGGASQAANLGRHHISFGPFGYFKSTANVFNSDFDHGTAQFLNYRYSFDEHTDLALDIHAWGQEKEYFGEKVTLTCGGLGLGFRYTMPPVSETFFFYLQGNFYDAVEGIEAGSESASWDGMGLGINGGFEMRLGRLISVPVEAFYLIAQPEDDISGYGFSAGVSFNWGKLDEGLQLEPERQTYRMPEQEPLAAQPVPSEPAPALAGTTQAEQGSVPSDSILPPAPAEAATPAASPTPAGQPRLSDGVRRHHVSAGLLGYFRAMSDDFRRLGADASEGQGYFLGYRHSFAGQFDLGLDLHGWSSEFRWQESDYMLRVDGIGTGIRYRFAGADSKLQPYIQANILSIGEHLTTVRSNTEDTKVYRRDYGFCLNGGLEIRLSKSVNVQLDLMLVYGRPAENITGIGITTGLGFDF